MLQIRHCSRSLKFFQFDYVSSQAVISAAASWRREFASRRTAASRCEFASSSSSRCEFCCLVRLTIAWHSNCCLGHLKANCFTTLIIITIVATNHHHHQAGPEWMTWKQNGPISNVPIWPQRSMMDGTGGLGSGIVVLIVESQRKGIIFYHSNTRTF